MPFSPNTRFVRSVIGATGYSRRDPLMQSALENKGEEICPTPASFGSRTSGSATCLPSRLTRRDDGALSGEGIAVPAGFATTTDAYVAENCLGPRISALLAAPGDASGKRVGNPRPVHRSEFPAAVAQEIHDAYAEFARRSGGDAIAEVLPDASFAGQQETFLNVRGPRALLDACCRCYASLRRSAIAMSRGSTT